MNDLDEILIRLPKLSVEEREQVRQRLMAMSSLGFTTVGDIMKRSASDSFESQVLGAIRDTLSSIGAEHVSITALQRGPYYKSFSDKLPNLALYFKPMSLSKTELSALLSVGVKLLYQNLMEMNVPIGARTMLNHIHRLPSVFNRHFPQYAQMGLLHVIVRREPNGSPVRGQGRRSERLQASRR